MEYILSQIGCHDIRFHGNYYTCANYDGDRSNAITQYCDNEYLNCVNYTRNIKYNKKSDYSTSIIDLICFNKQINFFQCIKFLCDILNLDYYEIENETDIPESLKVLDMLYEMKAGDFVEENYKLKPINEKILSYYKPYVNDLFANDGISYDIQKMFEIGYDDETDYITIPIRDELGNLVGVKGRAFSKVFQNKYLALEKYAKSKIVYGLDKSYSAIRKHNNCYILEAEKSVMQLYNIMTYNCGAIGGHELSKTQIIKLANLGTPITICFDKGIDKEIVLKSCEKMREYGIIDIYYMFDEDDILDDKQSPSDNIENWKILLENNVYRFEGLSET